jgi:hypothetical protein
MAPHARLLVWGVLAVMPLAAVSWERSGSISDRTLKTPALTPARAHQVLFSVDSYSAFSPDSALLVSIRQGTLPLAEKKLHQGDADLFVTFSVPRSEPVEIRLQWSGPKREPGRFSVRVDEAADDAVEREPNNSWRDATPVKLGSTVFASADDTPYIPAPGPPTARDTGADWYRFEFAEASPKLVYFEIDLMERDNLPVDVSVFKLTNNDAVAYREGEDPVTAPHEVQALPGNKFTTRVISSKGTYFIRVAASHPEYKLRTRLYNPPPYSDPREAVQTAVDYIMGAGDSWHANTPRRGGIYDRVANVHQETSLCVACHATHFPQRAQLYAARRGYAVNEKQQLQFLTERFYNNPRPFYGFEKEGAVWARVISAPANVLGRMSHLMQVFEEQISGERREEFHRGVREYLKLYYKNRTKLPPDETNGNTPLVSAYEVAWYAWEVTRDPAIAVLLAQDEIKNMVDLCYQTLALAAVDPVAHKSKIKANAARILSLQQPSGQWSMKFEPGSAEVEFQTGHALWALQAAGISADHPQVRKAIAYLLGRQQAFGGWMDPIQSFENFRTPFRETQMAVLALSAYFPREPSKGWNATQGAGSLSYLDGVWGTQPSATLIRLRKEAQSKDVMVRQQALEAIGRSGSRELIDVGISSLGDPSKLVQRTAAWAVRQIYTRNPELKTTALQIALRSPSSRTRWGATRVFATHFSSLTGDTALSDALLSTASDSEPAISIQALKGLWQWWYWTTRDDIRDRIEDVFLTAIHGSAHPWVQRNLREGLYSIADENIRYLYNNWIPSLSSAEDRKRAIRGRLAIEDRLGAKFIRVLEEGSNAERKELLAALTAFHLRRADVYDPLADSKAAPPAVYNRIGNDIEQIVFYGQTNARLARALRTLVESEDAELKKLAQRGVLMVRELRFPGVIETAGQPGEVRDKLVMAVAGGGDAEADVIKALTPRPAGPAKGVAIAAAAAEVKAPAPLAARRPDEKLFYSTVRPLLEKKGKDGYACVQCHATHTLFNGSYNTALNVIDVNRPEESLLLRKPVSSAESEGVAGSRTTAHGGGIRWEIGSAEYNAVLNWIRSAR